MKLFSLTLILLGLSSVSFAANLNADRAATQDEVKLLCFAVEVNLAMQESDVEIPLTCEQGSARATVGPNDTVTLTGDVTTRLNGKLGSQKCTIQYYEEPSMENIVDEVDSGVFCE